MHRLCKETVLILLGMVTLVVLGLGLDLYVLEGITKIKEVPFWTGLALVVSVLLYNVITLRYLYLLSGHLSRVQSEISYKLATK